MRAMSDLSLRSHWKPRSGQHIRLYEWFALCVSMINLVPPYMTWGLT